MLTRYSPLKSGPWHRKPPGPTSPQWKREEHKARMLKHMQDEAREKAEVYGCEYGQVFLREWFRLNGCPLCDSGRSPICHLHHVMPGRHGRKARFQAPLCPDCHRKGDSPGNSFAAMEAERGVNLLKVAAALASAGESQGYLPVEMCAKCGAWHSARFMVDGTGELLARLCQRCAPEGPP